MERGYNKSMDFLKHVRKELHKSAIFGTVMCGIFAIVCFYLAVAKFSKDFIIIIGVIPLPGTIAASVFGVLLTVGGLVSLKSYFTGYPSFVKKLEQIGDINILSEALANTPESEYTLGGELRYNNAVIFYMTSMHSFTPDITLIDPKRISAIQAQTLKNEPYVLIRYDNTVLCISTKKGQNGVLCQDMIEKCHVRTTSV